MDTQHVAKQYLKHLENAETDKIVALFAADGIVISPIYGTKSAKDFYTELGNDTTNSTLHFKGVFEKANSNEFALYFTYEWTMINAKVVVFDVVDIIKLDDNGKITELKIIYDTTEARQAQSTI